MKKLNLEELHNYIGYVVKINNILYTLVYIYIYLKIIILLFVQRMVMNY